MGLRLTNLTKEFDTYGNRTVAVDHIDLQIQSGSLVTLLGPSGCGKTTILRMIAGFEIPTAGCVMLEDADITYLPPNKRNISMVFQSYALFPHLTVAGNIAFGLKIKHLPQPTIRKLVSEMIDRVGLKGLEKRRPDQLSGGQQQRVALARSLVMKPAVLLFDEPLSNLDAKLRESMRLEIRRIQQEVGITSVYVTHDQVEAMSISDCIVVMQQGKIMQVASPFDVYSFPENSFVADFIGKVNFIDGIITEVKNAIATVYVKDLAQSFLCRNERMKKDSAVRIVLRPEGLTAQKKEGYNTIRGKILSYVFLGSHIEYTVLLKNQKILNAIDFNLAEHHLPVIHEEITLYFSEKSAWVIAAEKSENL